MNIGSLTGRIELEDAMSAGLGAATKQIKDFGDKFGAMGKSVAGTAAIVVGAVTGITVALYQVTKAAAEAGDRVGDFSLKTGLAVQKVAPLDFALKAAGGSLEQFDLMTRKLSLKQVGDDTGKVSRALGELNINAAAFNKMPLDQKAMALAKGFQEVKETGNAAAIATTLFGNGTRGASNAGADLLPVLNNLSPKLLEIAKRNAVVWTPELVENAGKFKISVSIIEQTLGTLVIRIGQDLLPVMSEFMETVANSPELLDAVVVASQFLVKAIGYIIQAMGYLLIVQSEVNKGWVVVIRTATEGVDKLLGVAQTAATLLTIVQPMSNVGPNAFKGIQAARTVLKSVGTEFEGLVDAWQKGGSALGPAMIKLGEGFTRVGTGAKDANEGIDRVGRNPALEKFSEDVDKMVKSLLGIPENLPEKLAALNKVIAMPDISHETIKKVVDELVHLREIQYPLNAGQKEFLSLWEDFGTKGMAATKTMQGYADAVKSAEDNLNLVGVALKNAQIDQKLAASQRDIGMQVWTGSLTSEQGIEAANAVVRAANAEKLKVQQDFDKAQLDEIYSYNASALAAHQELVLKDLDLTYAHLDAELEAAERGLRMKLAAGTISQETYEKTLMSVQTASEDKRLKATRDYNRSVADASVKNYATMLQDYNSYQEQAALIGLKGTDLAQAQLKQDYDARVNALEQMTDKSSEIWKRNRAAVEDWYNRQHELLEASRDDLAGFNQAMGSVLNTISKLASISAAGGGGKFSKVLEGVGQIAGFGELGAQAAKSYRTANVMGVEAQQKYDILQQGYFKGDVSVADYVKGGQSLKSAKIMSGVGKGMAVAEGAMNVWEATEGGGLKGIGGGAMAGMQAGAMFGPWGMAVGAAAGALVGVAKSFSNNTKKAREEFAKSMGKDSLGGLYEDLQKMGKEGEKLADVGMHVIGKKDEAGNKKWMDDVTKFYEDIQEQSSKLGASTAVWSEQQSIVAKHMAETAEGAEQLKAIQSEQVARAGAGISKALQISDTALKSYDEMNLKQLELRKQISLEEDPKALEGLNKELELTMKQLDKYAKVWNATQFKSEEAAKAVSSSVLAVAMQTMKDGGSFTEAIRGAGPAIEALRGQLAATGFEGGEAFNFLSEAAKIVNDELAGPALDAAAGYGDALSGLANAGMMNQDMFRGLAEQIGGTAAAIEEQGFSHGAVMAAMQGDLQTIWEMQEKYGYAVDDATQALIDEGVQSGLIGEQAKSDNQKILDVLVAIGEALGATIPEGLTKMALAGDTAAKSIEKDMSEASAKMRKDMETQAAAAGSALAGIADQTPEITIPVTYSTTQEGGGAEAPAYAGGGVVYAARGAHILPFRPRGTDTVPAMLTPGERVLSVDETKRYNSQQGGGDINVTLVMPDGDVLLKQIVKSRKRLG